MNESNRFYSKNNVKITMQRYDDKMKERKEKKDKGLNAKVLRL